MTPKVLLKVSVRNTRGESFSGESDRVSSFNEEGAFDIYPLHANFISIVLKELSVYLKGKKIYSQKFNQAIVKVKSDSVSVFLGLDELTLVD